MTKNKKPAQLTLVLGLILILLLGLVLIFLYQRRNCLSIDFLMCLGSKKFVSKSVNLAFRYPDFFPLAQPDEAWEIKQATKDFGRLETLDFSNEYYFNAGGEKLGRIDVIKSNFSNIGEYETDLLKPKTIFVKGREVQYPSPSVSRVKIGNNIEALSINYGNSLASLSSNSVPEYFFFKDGLMYIIAFNYNDYHHKLPKELYNKGFDLILSTLQI